MSWIFGFVAKGKSDGINRKKIHSQALNIYQDDRLYIAIGGNPDTTSFYDSGSCKSFFCGVPISKNFTSFLLKEEIHKIANSDFINEVNGHFCGVLINEREVTLITDKLGLREFHLFESEEGVYFSTRLDWILSIKKFEIDYHEFGARWLLSSQISTKSIIKDVIRINCGCEATITDHKIERKYHNWLPKKTGEIGIEEFNSILNSIIMLGRENNSKISLSLSGGLDSRVLLSYLMASNYTNWDSHTFRTEEIMDDIISRRIAEENGVEFNFVADEEKTQSIILEELRDFVGVTYLNESGFISRKLMQYKSLSDNIVVIDGGYGELWRRELLMGLLHFGKRSLLKGDYSVVANFMKSNKADLFDSDIHKKMDEGIRKQISALVNKLPSIKEVGVENWIDLFVVKTKLANIGSEQARMDNFVKGYMPFVQKGLLEHLFNVSVHQKENSKLFRGIIAKNYPNLTKYPLVKGKIPYPYWFTPLMKRAKIKIYNKFSKTNAEQGIDKYLMGLREFSLDSLASKSVKEYSPYDYKRIKKKVESYYCGNSDERSFVDWFITFELFRQVVDSE